MGKRVKAPRSKSSSRASKKSKPSKNYMARFGSTALNATSPYVRLPHAALKYSSGKSMSFNYHETVSINPGAAGITASNAFKANGMYDPNSTGIGHQPIGFDQAMAFFHHFTVCAAKITVQFVNTDATNVQFVGINCNTAGTISGDPSNVIENGNGVHTLIKDAGIENGPQTLCYYQDMKKFFYKDDIVGESIYQGGTGGDPSELCFFNVWGAGFNGVDGAAILCDVTITYYAVLQDPRELPSS